MKKVKYSIDDFKDRMTCPINAVRIDEKGNPIDETYPGEAKAEQKKDVKVEFCSGMKPSIMKRPE